MPYQPQLENPRCGQEEQVEVSFKTGRVLALTTQCTHTDSLEEYFLNDRINVSALLNSLTRPRPPFIYPNSSLEAESLSGPSVKVLTFPLMHKVSDGGPREGGILGNWYN